MAKKPTNEELKKRLKELQEELKLAQKALKEGEETYRLHFENASDVIFSIDPELKILSVSPSVKRIIGYKPEELNGESFLDLGLVADEYLEAATSDAMRVLAGEGIPSSVYAFIAKDGTRKFGEVSAAPLVRNGKVVGIVCVARDITDRKQAEQTLLDREEIYRSLFENTGTAMGIVEEDMTISMANNEFAKLSGYSKEEIEGKIKWTKFVVEEDLERIKGYHFKRRENEEEAPSEYEFRILDKQGNIKDVSIKTAMIPGTKRSVSSLVDITSHKEAEAALREKEERYRTILETIEDGYYETNTSGKFAFVNDSFCRIVGIPEDELIGTSYRRYTLPEAAEEVYATFNKVYTSGKATKGFGHEIIRKDGEKRYIELSISLMRDSEGHGIGFRGIVRDMTDRMQAEGALRQSEEKYRNILESIAEGYFEVDLSGNMAFFNDSLCRVTGYSREELMGKNNREYTTPETAKKMFRVFNEIYRTGKPASIRDYEIILKNGDRKVLELSASLVRDPSGEPVGFRGLVRDVTARKRAEKDLRESEERYRQLVEHAPSGMYEVDFVNRKFINVNDVILEYTGYTRDELLALSPLEILAEDSKQIFMQRLSKIFAGEKVPETVEYKIKRKDGKEIWAILNARILHENGMPKGASVIVHDITERKLAEEAVRESEEKYRLLVDNANDGIFIAQDGIIKFPNPKTKEVLGYSEEELSRVQYLDLIHPEDRALVEERQQRQQQGEEVPTTYTLRIVDKRGAELWAQINAVPITWEGRSATLNFVRDITPQKKLEAQLLQAQKMEAIGTMASGVGHNFRNILAVISMQSQMLQMKYPDDPELQEVADGINVYVERGAQLIEGLMQFSRRQTKKEYLALNLADLIRETHQLISISFDKMIDIQVDIPEFLPVIGDHSELSQVFMNLFTNARDAMPEGGELHIEAKKEGDSAQVVISDTGRGMEKETQERCFDPFFTTKEVDRGTGLGLSTTYGIVKEHGGEIQVYSALGQGTTFKLHFPLPPSGERPLKVSSTEIMPGRGQKILIVDDEKDMCKVMKELLKRLGYQAAYVDSGNAAIVKYKSWRPDLVLLDRNMPEMDGLSCAESVLDYDPDAKIVIISGYDVDGPTGMAEEKKRLIKGYLTKPIGMAKLSTQLARVLK
ncbi:MAG: PAS domain S-box protein [Desulfobacteraceae bacterium]